MCGWRRAGPESTRRGIGRPIAVTCATDSARRARSSRRLDVPAEYTYDYAIVRVVPRVERGETINVGVILSCPDVAFLEAGIELDESRLLALDEAPDFES